MDHDISQPELEVLRLKKPVAFRVCNVSSYTIDVMEIQADNPTFNVLFIPGNPGVVKFYKDFVEALYEFLGGTASVTAVGHISQTEKSRAKELLSRNYLLLTTVFSRIFGSTFIYKKNWEHGRLFSLQDQINIKMDFIKQELQNTAVPLLLVGSSSILDLFSFQRAVGSGKGFVLWRLNAVSGHLFCYQSQCHIKNIARNIHSHQLLIDPCVSLLKGSLHKVFPDTIGSYVSMEMFKLSPEKVTHCVGLYPFLALNPQSTKQASIAKIAESRFLCVALSCIVGILGLLPRSLLRLVVLTFLGKSWSAAAVEAACSHLVKYHTMRNILYLALTEFQALSETPDWAFMREYQDKIAFLFGIDDHWGPLQMYEEIGKQVPGAALSIEREGHTRAFCCTEAGSVWVAEHVASLMKTKVSL